MVASHEIFRPKQPSSRGFHKIFFGRSNNLDLCFFLVLPGSESTNQEKTLSLKWTSPMDTERCLQLLVTRVSNRAFWKMLH